MNDNLIYDLYSYAFKHDLPLIVDAADEIKRLRLRVKELEGLIDSAMEADYNNEYFRTHHK